jgi:anion-transporting  ArsA/GET3 family ATPase
MAVNLLKRLEQRQVVVITGKGGVGKTTVTAALGARLAARGREVLLLEVDPRENLHQLLGVRPSGGQILKAGPRLRLQHLDPRGVLDDLVRDKLKVGALVRRVLSSPIHQQFTEGAPGLKETAVFGRALRLVEGFTPRGVPTPDVVLLDAPATGHGISWLAAPQLISEVIETGPVGHMAAEIAAFMADPRRFGVVVVATAEEMPVQESLELLAGLRGRTGRTAEAVVVNALYPPLPGNVDPADEATTLWLERRRLNERELGRLRASWDGPLLELPLLPVDPGPPLVTALGQELEGAARTGP